jgi:hypothetical protein
VGKETFHGCCVFGLAVLLCAALHVNPANAQVTPPSITLYSAGITHSVPRDGYRPNHWLNYSDCAQNDVIDFPLTVTGGASGYQLQAWAGSNDCTIPAVRASAQGQCFLLYSSASGSANPALEIQVRSILAGYTLLNQNPAMTPDAGAIDAGATSTVPVAILTNLGAEACDEPAAMSPSPIPIQVYFMLVDPSNSDEVVGTWATWNASAKLDGPPPPDTLTAAVGDRELVLHFSYDDQESDQTLNGYQFYCDPQPGLAAAADAGLAPTDAGVAACGAEPSQVLIPAAPHLNLPLPCGTAPLTATGGTVSGLVNGVPYDVAVAARDTYENVGPLSMLACDVPEPSKNSQNVRACSFSPRRATAPIFPLGALLACWLWRRRRGRQP